MEYSYVKNTNAPKLLKEIRALNLPGFKGIYTMGQDVRAIFDFSLSPENKGILDVTVDVHTNGPDSEAYVSAKISKAKEFGENTITEFGARNIILGLSTGQIRQVMNKLSDVTIALSTGSLNVAIDAIDSVQPDAVLTTELIAQYRAKIVSFLATL